MEYDAKEIGSGYSRADIKREARECISGNLGKCFLLTLTMAGISLAASRLLSVKGFASLIVGWLVSNIDFGIKDFYLNIWDFVPIILCYFVPIILCQLLGLILDFGMRVFYLNIGDEREAKISDLFEGFNGVIGVLGLQLLMKLWIFLFSLLLFIPGIIKTYSYAMAVFIKIENPNMKASDVLKASSEMMDGHKMELFMLNLSFIGWCLLVPLTFGLASIYVLPYIQASMARFYRNIQ